MSGTDIDPRTTMDTENESIANEEQPSESKKYSLLSEPSSSYEHDMHDDELPDQSVLDRKLGYVSITKIDINLFKYKEKMKTELKEAVKIIRRITRTRTTKRKYPFETQTLRPVKSGRIERSVSTEDMEEKAAEATDKQMPIVTTDQHQSAIIDATQFSACAGSSGTGDHADSTPVEACSSGTLDMSIVEIKLHPQIKDLLDDRAIQYKIKLYLIQSKQHSSFTLDLSELVTKSGKARLRREMEHSKCYILFFYRITKIGNRSIPEIFALTTGSSWQIIKPYADKDFTKLVERRTLGFPFQHVEFKRDSGPITKETQTARTGSEILFTVWDYLDKLVGNRIRKPRDDSSLYSEDIEAFLAQNGKRVSSRINVTKKSLKINRRLSITDMSRILNHFSKICSQEKTCLTNETRDEEKDDPMFTMLELIGRVTNKKIVSELNESLYKVMKDSMCGIKSGIFLMHSSIEKWLIADEFHLYARKPVDCTNRDRIQKRKRKMIKTWDIPPSLDEVMQELCDYCGNDFHPDWLEDVTLKFNSMTAPLKKYIFSRFSTMCPGTYIYKHGVWLEVKGQYLHEIEAEFVGMIKKYKIDSNELLLLPWKYPGKKKKDSTYQVNDFDMEESKKVWKMHFSEICKTSQFDKVTEEIEKIQKGDEEVCFNFKLLKDMSKERMAANLYCFLECNLYEDDYNAAHTLLNMILPDDSETTIITCDKKTPYGIELCDLLVSQLDTTYLVHVKAGFKGDSIRDVCSQIRNAADHVYRHQMKSAGTGIISAFWDKLMQPSKKNPGSHENQVKMFLESRSEEKFQDLFLPSRKIVFVLACRDINKDDFCQDGSFFRDLGVNISDAVRSTFKRYQPQNIIDKLVEEKYLTDERNLTNKFILEGKQKKTKFVQKVKAWEEIKNEKMADELFDILVNGLSRSKATIAKMEIVRLVKDFQHYWVGQKNFELKICNISREFSDK